LVTAAGHVKEHSHSCVAPVKRGRRMLFNIQHIKDQTKYANNYMHCKRNVLVSALTTEFQHLWFEC